MILPFDEDEYNEMRNPAPCATPAEADAEFAINAGRENSDRPWILSHRDVWYRNPFYLHPAGQPYPRHPEDDSDF